ISSSISIVIICLLIEFSLLLFFKNHQLRQWRREEDDDNEFARGIKLGILLSDQSRSKSMRLRIFFSQQEERMHV
ncbi:hypothetical protein MKW98_021087, partial [Papaver atlanticum]